MKRKLEIFLALGFLVLLPTVFVIGVNHGKALSHREARKTLYVDAKSAQTTGDKKLFEYIKHKYYFHSNRSKLNFRVGEGDFGPIDENLLEGYYPGKETSWKEEYLIYKKSMPQPL